MPQKPIIVKIYTNYFQGPLTMLKLHQKSKHVCTLFLFESTLESTEFLTLFILWVSIRNFFFFRLIEIKIWLEKKVDFDFRHFIYIKRTCKYYYLFSFRSDLLKFLISWKIKLSSGGRPYNSPNMPGRRLVLKCISYSNRVCYTLIQHCLA